MEGLRLQSPIHTPETGELLPAGALVCAETVEALIQSTPPPQRFKSYPMLDHGMVKKDLLRQTNRPPYDAIFTGRNSVADIVNIISEVHLAEPVLRSLDYFKEHDYHTYCHILMVYALSTLIAKDLSPDYRDWVQGALTGPTHDIGKICVPLSILKKKTPLTKAEKKVLDHHTLAGYVLLGYYHGDPNNLGALVARDHHERRDGSGKPEGKIIDNRMVEIVIACDVYDALVSPRPYRPVCYDNRAALDEITKMAEEGKVHWDIVRALVAYNRKDKPAPAEAEVSTIKRGMPPPGNFYGVVAD